MSLVLENYDAYVSHLESLAQTDWQALIKDEIHGTYKKKDRYNICCKYVNLP